MKCLLKLPGKPDKILENVNYEKLLPQVEALGGTLTEIKEVDPLEELFKARTEKLQAEKEKQTSKYEFAKEVFKSILNQYFSALKGKEPKFEITNFRSKRTLGLASYRKHTVFLSEKLIGAAVKAINKLEEIKAENNIKQVIFHELTHFEFPWDGHSGQGFRRKEFNNPWRSCRTNRLTSIS